MYSRNSIRPAILLVAALVFTSPTSSPQDAAVSSTSHLAFDAASIHERAPGGADLGVIGMRQSPGRITNPCATLTQFIYFAFNFSFAAPVENFPKWADGPCAGTFSNTYEFQATFPANATPDQIREMMQSLLAERFKFAYHWESKPMSVYALTVLKSGFKLKPYDPKIDKPIYGSQFFCPPEDPNCHSIALHGPASVLAKFLSGAVGRPVVDQTGLTDEYQFGFNWAGDASADSPLPSLPSVLKEKFGLELKSTTAPVNVMIIDHVEKPAPN